MENHKLSQLTDKTYTTILAMAKEALANEIERALAARLATAPLFRRVAVPILSSSSSSETISPLNWLSAQENEQKIYWGDRDNLFESAAIGECASFEIENLDERHQLVGKIEKLLRQSSDNIRFYGGMRFPSERESGANSEEWQAFGAAKFVLPRFELVHEAGQTLFVCNLNLQTDAAAADRTHQQQQQPATTTSKTNTTTTAINATQQQKGYGAPQCYCSNSEIDINPFPFCTADCQNCPLRKRRLPLIHEVVHCYSP